MRPLQCLVVQVRIVHDVLFAVCLVHLAMPALVCRLYGLGVFLCPRLIVFPGHRVEEAKHMVMNAFGGLSCTFGMLRDPGTGKQLAGQASSAWAV